MKRIIDGKRYDTDTATEVADVGSVGYSTSDFLWHDTRLYRTPRGSWFLAGEGGPMTRWARSVGNSRTGGEGIEPISADEAREILEQHGHTSALEGWFGGEIEDA